MKERTPEIVLISLWGLLDSVHVTYVVCIYIMSKLENMLENIEVWLYRDDQLLIPGNTTKRSIDNIKKNTYIL